MSAWFSIEVFDGASSASVWADAHRDTLIETALTHGAGDWAWHRHTWGVVFEVSFADESLWDDFLELPVVQAVLDAVPDPVTGVIAYRGRGGSSGASYPRKPQADDRLWIPAALPCRPGFRIRSPSRSLIFALPCPTLVAVGAR